MRQAHAPAIFIVHKAELLIKRDQLHSVPRRKIFFHLKLDDDIMPVRLFKQITQASVTWRSHARRPGGKKRGEIDVIVVVIIDGGTNGWVSRHDCGHDLLYEVAREHVKTLCSLQKTL